MTLTTNMNIGIHPLVVRKGIAVTSCDNFFIGSDGRVERLHRTPLEIVELG